MAKPWFHNYLYTNQNISLRWEGQISLNRLLQTNFHGIFAGLKKYSRGKGGSLYGYGK